MKEHRNFLMKKLIDYPIPSRLFHYTSTSTEKIIRDTSQLRLSKFNHSNDYLEFSYGLNLVEALLKQFKEQDVIKEAFIEKFLIFFEEEKRNPQVFFYMICFCQNSKNSYLKKYYSKKGGVIMSFDFQRQDFSGRAGLTSPIIYSKRFFQRMINKGLNNYYWYMRANLNKWEVEGSYDDNMKNLMLTLIRDLFAASSFIKKPKYYAEKEFRIILWGTDHQEKYLFLPLSSGVLL